MTTQVIALPLTDAAIDAEFAGRNNAGLRANLKAAAKYGSLPKHPAALTAFGEVGLAAVRKVLDAERESLGYGRYCVGPAGSYDGAPIVAFLDQPA